MTATGRMFMMMFVLLAAGGCGEPELAAGSVPGSQPDTTVSPSASAPGLVPLPAVPSHAPPVAPPALTAIPSGRPRPFIIAALRQTDVPRTPASYGAEVLAATRQHLAAQLTIPIEDVAVLEHGPAELAVADPCGSWQVADRPQGGGLTVGHAVTLQAGGVRYRYAAHGGLAFPCGPEP